MINKYGDQGSRGLVHGPAYESADVPDDYFVDGFSTQLAIATLQDHLKRNRASLFFLLLVSQSHISILSLPKDTGIYMIGKKSKPQLK